MIVFINEHVFKKKKMNAVSSFELPGHRVSAGGPGLPRELGSEGHSQLQGWDGSWIWVQLCDIFGLFFFFPCKVSSAMAEAVAAPWLCCAGGSGETPGGRGGGAAAPPARLLPGTAAPFRALPGCELAAPHPSHSTDH